MTFQEKRHKKLKYSIKYLSDFTNIQLFHTSRKYGKVPQTRTERTLFGEQRL
jgi:hypothetical protein